MYWLVITDTCWDATSIYYLIKDVKVMCNWLNAFYCMNALRGEHMHKHTSNIVSSYLDDRLMYSDVYYVLVILNILMHVGQAKYTSTDLLVLQMSNWGEPERAPHIRDVHEFCLSVCRSVRS